jgi:hypothetical protein
MSSSTTASGAAPDFRQQTPNRLTRHFQAMKEEICPDAIRSYARCVVNANEEGTLSKGSCQKEFDAVKDCFKTARQRLRQQQI